MRRDGEVGQVEEGDLVEVRRHRLHLRSVDWAPAVVTEVREKLLLVRLEDDSLLMIARGDHEWRPPTARCAAIESAARALLEAIGPGGSALGATSEEARRAVEALEAACAKKP